MPYTYFIKKIQSGVEVIRFQKRYNIMVFYFLSEGNKNTPFSVPGCGGERAGRGSKMFDLRILL